MIIAYEMLDPEDFEVRYVGLTTQTLGERLRQHCRKKGKWHSTYWIQALKKRGLKPIIREFYRTEDNDEADSVEISLIAYYRSLGYALTNHEDGGRGCYIMSDETKAKIGIARKGKGTSQETKEKMSISRTGKKQSPETIAKRVAANTGRACSTETKAKIGIANTGKKRTDEAKAKMSANHRSKKK